MAAVSPTPHSSSYSSFRPSRQAARNASATIASYREDLPANVVDDEDLLKEAVRPMSVDDTEDHKAWVEMESDPVR